LDNEELDLAILLIVLVSQLASDLTFVKVEVLLLAGLMYAGLGCTEGGAEGMEDIGMGDSDTDWIARDEWLDGLRKVNSSG